MRARPVAIPSPRQRIRHVPVARRRRCTCRRQRVQRRVTCARDADGLLPRARRVLVRYRGCAVPSPCVQLLWWQQRVSIIIIIIISSIIIVIIIIIIVVVIVTSCAERRPWLGQWHH